MAQAIASSLPPQTCEFCGAEISPSRDRRWQRSPHGRPYCPECGRIPSDHQRSYDEVVVAHA